MRKSTTLAAAIAAAVIASSAPALAQGVSISTRCNHGYGSGGCETVVQGFGAPEPLTNAEVEAIREEDRRWLEYCKPQRTYDKLGVVRLVYAHDGCGFGVSGEKPADEVEPIRIERAVR